MEVTNNSAAGLVLNGLVDGKAKSFSLKPNETKEFDLIESKANAARIKSGAISVEGKAKSADDDKATERDELKKQADELGVQYPGNISNVKLKELIDAKLAE
jgi:hypothetical protein